jgi:GNAT superfamily N-acetyltransferase
VSTATVAGQAVELRLLEAQDGNLICHFFDRLSPETVYRRFMAPVVPPAEGLVKRLLNIDHCQREGLVAIDADGIAGVVRYAPFGPGAHEVAIVVADDWQRKGLGTMLMTRLAHIARARGIVRFHATMLADNRGARIFLQHFSPRSTFRFVDGIIEAEVPLRQAA